MAFIFFMLGFLAFVAAVAAGVEIFAGALGALWMHFRAPPRRDLFVTAGPVDRTEAEYERMKGKMGTEFRKFRMGAEPKIGAFASA